MRFGILLASASLFACAQNETENADVDDIAVDAAMIGYAGADYGDNATAMLAHGERLSLVLGCQNCHGSDYSGGNITEVAPELGDVWAKNLSLLLPEYSDAELETVLRRGIPKDGRSMLFMPSEMYRNLSEADMAALIAHLRTVEPMGEQTPDSSPSDVLVGLAATWGIEPGVPMEQWWAGRRAADLGDDHAMGRYIAESGCTECHNLDLSGYADFSPDLAIAATYDREEFRALMRTGKGKTRDDLGYMSWAAKDRFTHMTDAEIDTLHDYLGARAEAQEPQ